MKRFFASAALLASVAFTAPGYAASSDWHVTEGGEIRLVTAGGVDENGRLKGALEIVLHPGWKTYWIDPGDAGVPPQIDVSASRDISAVDIQFPAPQRFDDGYAVWAGYKNHVALALDFAAGSDPHLEADIFLGVCEKICIPVQLQVSLDPDKANDGPGDAAIVEAAFAGLPEAPSEAFQLKALRIAEQDTIRAEITVPEETKRTELFVASAHGWYFGTPELAGDGGSFDIPILARPKDRGDPPAFAYTLISDGVAVGGAMALSPPPTE